MNGKLRWLERFSSYEKAFLSLRDSKDAFERKPKDLFIRDSLIQRYEYTIELSWKLLKNYLKEEDGLEDVGESPKKVIKAAFKNGYIDDVDAFLKAWEGRTLTSHAYDEELAEKVTSDITSNYFPLLENLYSLFLTKRHERRE